MSKTSFKYGFCLKKHRSRSPQPYFPGLPTLLKLTDLLDPPKYPGVSLHWHMGTTEDRAGHQDKHSRKDKHSHQVKEYSFQHFPIMGREVDNKEDTEYSAGMTIYTIRTDIINIV